MKRFLLGMAVVLLGSCTTTKYVTVPEVHEHWHHSTDTIHKTDSVIDRQMTTIREVDSATMARYGIRHGLYNMNQRNKKKLNRALELLDNMRQK